MGHDKKENLNRTIKGPRARTRSCSAGGIVLLLTRRSAQPVIFNHSSRGLGHGPNKHFAFVYTKALLAVTIERLKVVLYPLFLLLSILLIT